MTGTRDDVNFGALTDYLRAELQRTDANLRTIRLASEHSFVAWAHSVLGEMASALGLSLGFLVGWATEAYAVVKQSFASSFRTGMARGRGV